MKTLSIPSVTGSAPHQRHRPMLHFGCTERFGVQAARFFELQRCFLSDAQAVAAPDDKQIVRTLQDRQGCAPVEFPGALELVRRADQRIDQRSIVGPARGEMDDGAERCDV